MSKFIELEVCSIEEESAKTNFIFNIDHIHSVDVSARLVALTDDANSAYGFFKISEASLKKLRHAIRL